MGATQGSSRSVLHAGSGIPATAAPRALTDQERDWARAAWSYFENNTDMQTGLVSSQAGARSATLWDTGSYLLALVAAHDLGLIEKKTFDIRLAKALVSLERMPLLPGKLPNKSYDIGSLAMTDARDQAVLQGGGWSAIDIGRLLVPLNVVVWHHPVHTPAARRVLARWDTAALAREGRLVSTEVGGSRQGAGYEHHAARGLAALAVHVDGNLRCANGDDAAAGEPFLLSALAFGWTRELRECAWQAYRARERRGVPRHVAFAWHALFRTGESAELAAKSAPGPEAGSAHENAVVLESLAYLARGPAQQATRPGERKP